MSDWCNCVELLGVQTLHIKRGYCLQWMAEIRNRCVGVQEGGVGEKRMGEGGKARKEGKKRERLFVEEERSREWERRKEKESEGKLEGCGEKSWQLWGCEGAPGGALRGEE